MPRHASPASAAGPPRRFVRRHPWLAALALLLVAVAVLIALWDWNWFRGPVERAVHASTGRSFDIGGDLDVDLGWTPRISAERVRFGNAAWAREPTMAAAERVDLRLELGALLRGRAVVPELRLRRPTVLLEIDPASGAGNWAFGERGGESRVRLRSLWVDQGRLRFVDPRRRTDIRVGLASERVRGGPAPVRIAGGGLWRGSAFRLSGVAASPLGLRDADAPYRIDLRARAGRTRAHARGTLFDPLRLRHFDLQFALSGQDLAELYPLVGLALPPTPRYALDGRLRRENTLWRYSGFRGRVGDSDLSGEAGIETGGARPYFRADLHSRLLDFDDLAGLVGAPPDVGDDASAAARERRDGRVLPDTPYELEKLRAMDADVRLRAARIQAPKLPLDDMDAHLLLENGLLRLDPLDFGVAGGRLRSTVRMDARGAPIRTAVQAEARGMDLSRLLPQVQLMRNAVGKAGGRVDLRGTGNSIAAMLGSSDGEVALGMGPGRISNLLMEMAGIDLAEILKFKLAGDRMIPVRCAFADFAVADGAMTARSLAFDSTDTILIGAGTIGLRDETLDLTIRPRPKDRSLLALRTPLRVDGTFAKPRVRPDLGALGLRGAVALGLGSIAPPAALLATLELGPGQDAACGGRYAR
ncbi:AsmA family protein [Vulcaniibacterium tengchongense]|nr:AsmA family protein [Vulcaniibacterium tengchongense]